jgi:hypothetical protein
MKTNLLALLACDTAAFAQTASPTPDPGPPPRINCNSSEDFDGSRNDERSGGEDRMCQTWI